MIVRLYICLLFIASVFTAEAQQTAASKHKLGIKTSINFSTLLGNEFENPRLKYGYTAGAYYRSINKKDWHLYSEIVGNFKGSNFSNGDTGYSRIASFYVDFAAVPMYNLSDKTKAVGIGAYGSYLGLSSMFVGDQKKAELNSINLAPLDAGLAAYYHSYGKSVTFQFGAKLGITNANDGINFIGYFPTTGNGGFIRNLSFEIGMLF